MEDPLLRQDFCCQDGAQPFGQESRTDPLPLLQRLPTRFFTGRQTMNNRPTESGPWTVARALQWTTAYFTGKGIQTARLDAELLLAHALNVDRLQLYLNFDRPLLPGERQQYRELVARRGRREPVALITGTKEFWSILFRIVPGVLIPRPDTEILVQAVLDEIRGLSSPQILEIGTGSGAITVAIARQRPDARVVATDADLAPVRTASTNAKDAGVASSVAFLAMDLFAALRPGTRFDVICSNPPYVPSDTIPTLEPEIVDFEPVKALDGGKDGLQVIRQIAQAAGDYVKAGGWLVLEIGDEQGDPAKAILAAAGITENIRVLPDLAGRPRVIKGRIPE